MIDSLQGQNAIAAVGAYNTSDRIYVRPEGVFNNLDDIRALPLNVGGRTLR